MNVFFFVLYGMALAGIGCFNYRVSRQKAAELVEQIKQFNN